MEEALDLSFDRLLMMMTRGEHTMAFKHDAGVKSFTPSRGNIHIFLAMSVTV